MSTLRPPQPIRRALLSVSDKSDLVPFARALASRGVTIISTGGTAKALAEAGIAVTPVEKVTGFPEGLGGRVKTLHPGIHAALLALRGDPEHEAFLAKHGIEPIDLVCINLYPFQRAVAEPGCTFDEAIENIDIGGPAMVRAAAKNHAAVTVVTSSRQYDRVIAEMDGNGGATTVVTRKEFAAAAFARTAEYDGAIAAYLGQGPGALFPPVLEVRVRKVEQLRYGENPQQQGALYAEGDAGAGSTIVGARQLHGKELSYNNIYDGAWALEAMQGLVRAARGVGAEGAELHAAVIVKHTNPCGGALAESLSRAVEWAILGDPIAAYGGIVALGSVVDGAAARALCAKENFFEVVIAPAFDEEALALLRARWANVRLLAVGQDAGGSARTLEYRSVPGGILAQERDVAPSDAGTWEHRAGPPPSPEMLWAATALEALCRCVMSNAVVIGGGGPGVRLFGVGSGQVDRVSACRLAAMKAGANARGAIAVGDAFFPFADGAKVLIDAGVKMVVHPGGSKRDEETFALCAERGVTCVVTGLRRFRH